jgi:hypothetical protein
MRAGRREASVSAALFSEFESYRGVFFTEVKAFIKKHWEIFESDPDQDFEAYLNWCVEVVGRPDLMRLTSTHI